MGVTGHFKAVPRPIKAVKNFTPITCRRHEISNELRMAHNQKTSVGFLRKLLAQEKPENLPLINSYVSANRDALLIIEGLDKELRKYPNSHYVR